jgi:hypothetical protein
MGHQLIQFGAPGELIYLWDITVILLFIKTFFSGLLHAKNLRIKFYGPIFGIIAVLVISHLLNRTTIMQTLLFSRYLLIGYLLFFSIFNLKLTSKDIKTVINFAIFLFLIQIPASVVKLLLIGQGERSVGTFGFSPGTWGTLVPLIAISFLLALFFYEKRKKYVFLFLIVGFIGFSLIAEKRAFIFFLPLIFLSILILYDGNKSRKMKYIFFCLFLFSATGYFYPKLNPTFNPQNKVGGDFDLHHIYNYVNYYVNSKDIMGNSSGRLATTKMTFKNLASSRKFFLFGDGPGKFINSGIIKTSMEISKFKYNIEDGVTGFAWISLQIGLLGFLFFISFLISVMHSIYLIFRSTADRNLKIFGLGLLGTGFVFILDIVVYSKAFVAGRNLSLVFFLFSAFYLKYWKESAHCKLFSLTQLKKAD